MITLHDTQMETDELVETLTDEIRLLKALANFHVPSQADEQENDLINQRTQLLNRLDLLARNFDRLISSWNESIETLDGEVSYESEKESHREIISKFIKTTVPNNMQQAWSPDSFTGSLLVFFVDGQIESSSLVEKREHPEHSDKQPEEDKSAHETPSVTDDAPVQVVAETSESFTILKSLVNSDINIYFYLPEPARVIIKIYNQKDQLVRLVEKNYDEPGDYSAAWDGRDNDGDILAKETYYCQLQIGETLSELKTIELS